MKPTTDATSTSGSLDLLLSAGTKLLVLGSIVATLIYWYALNGRLSHEPSDWGAFGSYLGGILGPAVAFVALIAVLKTISLQRSAANIQLSQFTQMQAMQKDVTDAQNKQLELAAQAAADERNLTFKAAVMKAVEHQIAYYTNGSDALDRKLQLLATLPNADASATPEQRAQLLHLADQRGIAQLRIKGLQDFVMDFMLTQHVSIEAVQADARDKLIAAYAD